jgi:hypothetical protein
LAHAVPAFLLVLVVVCCIDTFAGWLARWLVRWLADSLARSLARMLAARALYDTFAYMLYRSRFLRRFLFDLIIKKHKKLHVIILLLCRIPTVFCLMFAPLNKT